MTGTSHCISKESWFAWLTGVEKCDNFPSFDLPDLIICQDTQLDALNLLAVLEIKQQQKQINDELNQ